MDQYMAGRLIDAIREGTRALKSLANTYKEDVEIKREQWEYTKAMMRAEEEALTCSCDCNGAEDESSKKS